ncbi:MAG: hypothetical protein ACOCXJ_06565, partial [Planctomycetota bacterium]
DRAVVAVRASAHELAQYQPELRPRSHDLARAALLAIARLIEVGGDMPPPGGGESADGGGGGGQGQERPAYPPRAALNMLRLAQERLARQTLTVRSRHPLEDQDALLQLIEPLMGQVRPGTRPAQLLERTRGAMESAIGGIVRDESRQGVALWQRTAADALQRILDEMQVQMQQPQGSGGDSQQQRQDQRQTAAQQQAGAQDSQQAGTDGSQTEAQGGAQAMEGLSDEQKSWLLRLPAVQRQRLLEAFDAAVPPEGVQLYRRYLDLLEDGR